MTFVPARLLVDAPVPPGARAAREATFDRVIGVVDPPRSQRAPLDPDRLGAAAVVFGSLPPDHSPWKRPNASVTPHISGSSLSPRFQERLWDIFTLNLERYRRGARLLNELSAAQLAGD